MVESRKSEKRFVFRVAVDILLLEEVCRQNPFASGKSDIWSLIVDNLNTDKLFASDVDERTIKERVAELLSAYYRNEIKNLYWFGTDEQFGRLAELLVNVSEMEKGRKTGGDERKKQKSLQVSAASLETQEKARNSLPNSGHNTLEDGKRKKSSKSRAEKDDGIDDISYRSSSSVSRSRTRSSTSRRSSRSHGLSDKYLEQYHRDWLLHWNMQQQMNQSQMYGYGGMQSYYPPAGTPILPSAWPTAGMSYSMSTSNLSEMGNVNGASSAPVTPYGPPPSFALPPSFLPGFSMAPPQDLGNMIPQESQNSVAVNGSLQTQKPAFFVGKPAPSPRPSLPNILSLPRKDVMRPLHPTFHGVLLSTTKSAGIEQTGRSTSVLVKAGFLPQMEKYRVEMEMFPGMMLWDDNDLRDKVVDFCRHMSSMIRESEDSHTSDMEAVFWDLVVHLVSRGENSRPYEVAQILAGLLEDPGRSSVASVRSEANTRSGREKYAESSLVLVRRCLLAGDIESATIHAENGDLWDLALCLQTVSSNVECKNQQANDLALRVLDQKLQRGDPVHTLCFLACGKLPSVEACFKDWVSNLAVVLACSSFISQEDLKSRFITNLADLLHTTGMPMARDICTIFGNPERRFRMQPFMLIGSDDGEFSLTNFFMTEVFVYLAQIFQGVNLHVNVDLIKLEFQYVQHLLDHDLPNLAMEYCRSIAVVVRDYGVQLNFEHFAHFMQILTNSTTDANKLFQENWFQWLWNIFDTWKNRHHKPKERGDITAENSSVSSETRQQFTEVPQQDLNSLATFQQGTPTDHVSTSRRPSSVLDMEPQLLPPDYNTAKRPSDLPVIPLHEEMNPVFRSRQNSVQMTPVDSVVEDSVPAVPMFSTTTTTTAPPPFFNPFPPSGLSTPFGMPLNNSLEISTPADSPLNTGNLPHFANIQQPENDSEEEEKENANPKVFDPTKAYDDLDSIAQKPKVEDKKPAAVEVKKTGWFGSWFSKFKRGGQIHLPDDKEPKLVYDKEKKRWVDKSKPDNEAEEVVAPPPKMAFPQPDFASANINPAGPLAGTPSGTPSGIPSGPPMPNGNLFRLSSRPSNSGYNPYATIMAGLQTAPLKPVELTNYFIPSIPEE